MPCPGWLTFPQLPAKAEGELGAAGPISAPLAQCAPDSKRQLDDLVDQVVVAVAE